MQNDMRDRLVGLLNQRQDNGNYKTIEEKSITLEFVSNENLADHLIANGVIVPPCKVGKSVWFYSEYFKDIFELKVIGFEYDIERGLYLCCENKTNFSVEKQLGKTLFLTREQAEQKLKEMRVENGNL